jgi:ribonuclease HII
MNARWATDGSRTIAGIDEAGRGPLAGPVAVGIFAVQERDLPYVRKIFRGVKESKQLSPEEREKWYERIENAAERKLCAYHVSLKGARVIDAKGINSAIRLSINSCLTTLDVPHTAFILLDGGLRAPRAYAHQRTIIKGDEKEMLIALASICAKVARDRRMVEFSKRYPEYHFHVHKGYGTKAHVDEVRVFGLCPIHRRSFMRKYYLQSDIAKSPVIR